MCLFVNISTIFDFYLKSNTYYFHFFTIQLSLNVSLNILYGIINYSLYACMWMCLFERKMYTKNTQTYTSHTLECLLWFSFTDFIFSHCIPQKLCFLSHITLWTKKTDIRESRLKQIHNKAVKLILDFLKLHTMETGRI